MNKTGIEYCDMTFNPVTGCYGPNNTPCAYCYAKGITKRFGEQYVDTDDFLDSIAPPHIKRIATRLEGLPIYELTEPCKNPYPFGFAPTFHRYRLLEPAKVKKPQTIFVGSMTDLFHDAIPDEWIKAVFEACEAAPWHKYLFLTKSPHNLPPSSYLFNGVFGDHADNYWFGKTATNQNSLEDGYKHFSNISGNTYLCIEPLLEAVDLLRIDVGDVIYNIPLSRASYMFGMQKIKTPKWVIVGSMTGSNSEKHRPRREWIENIAEQCRAANIPLFVKNSLRELMGDAFVQETPW